MWIRYNKENGELTGWSSKSDLPLRMGEAMAFIDLPDPPADDYELYLFKDGQLIDSGKPEPVPRPDYKAFYAAAKNDQERIDILAQAQGLK